MSERTKKDVLLELLGEGIVMVHLDARRPGVVLPAHLMRDPHVRLNFSHSFGLRDLLIDDEKVSASLSFGSLGDVFCAVPWTAVFGLHSLTTHENVFWPQDMDGDVVQALLTSAIETRDELRPALRSVPTGAVAPAEPPAERSQLKTPPHLRIVRPDRE